MFRPVLLTRCHNILTCRPVLAALLPNISGTPALTPLVRQRLLCTGPDCPFALLGLPATASREHVKEAFKQRALETHPDLNPNLKDGEANFKRLNEAYETSIGLIATAAANKQELQQKKQQQAAAATAAAAAAEKVQLQKQAQTKPSAQDKPRQGKEQVQARPQKRQRGSPPPRQRPTTEDQEALLAWGSRDVKKRRERAQQAQQVHQKKLTSERKEAQQKKDMQKEANAAAKAKTDRLWLANVNNFEEDVKQRLKGMRVLLLKLHEMRQKSNVSLLGSLFSNSSEPLLQALESNIDAKMEELTASLEKIAVWRVQHGQRKIPMASRAP